MPKPRVLIADDHTLVAEGIKKLLESEVELLGVVSDGRALLTKVEKLEPDLVLVDINLPLLNGIDAARQIRKVAPRVKIIFLTMHAEKDLVSEAFRLGASGYVLKQGAAPELQFAVQQVMKGYTYVSPTVAGDLIQGSLENHESNSQPKKSANLTARQREVLQLIAEGKTTKEIALTLNVSVKTVEFHKTKIMKELDIHSATEITKYAIAQGLVFLS